MAASHIQSHRDLRAWQLAYSLGLAVYRATESMPSSERFGLVSQMRRAAVAVPSNIAEGYGRGSTQDYVRFLKIARGSLFEVDTQLSMARDLGFVAEEQFHSLSGALVEVSKVLAGLIRSVDPNA